jgi:hypothetical protein
MISNSAKASAGANHGHDAHGHGDHDDHAHHDHPVRLFL